MSRKVHVPPDKPIVEMNHLEFEQTFDDIGIDIRKAMLKEARTKGLDVHLVITTLIMPDGKKSVLTYNAEYGDFDGWNRANEFAAEFARNGELLQGESIQVQLVAVTGCEELESPIRPARPKGNA